MKLKNKETRTLKRFALFPVTLSDLNSYGAPIGSTTRILWEWYYKDQIKVWDSYFKCYCWKTIKLYQ